MSLAFIAYANRCFSYFHFISSSPVTIQNVTIRFKAISSYRTFGITCRGIRWVGMKGNHLNDLINNINYSPYIKRAVTKT